MTHSFFGIANQPKSHRYFLTIYFARSEFLNYSSSLIDKFSTIAAQLISLFGWSTARQVPMKITYFYLLPSFLISLLLASFVCYDHPCLQHPDYLPHHRHQYSHLDYPLVFTLRAWSRSPEPNCPFLSFISLNQKERLWPCLDIGLIRVELPRSFLLGCWSLDSTNCFSLHNFHSE